MNLILYFKIWQNHWMVHLVNTIIKISYRMTHGLFTEVNNRADYLSDYDAESGKPTLAPCDLQWYP